MGYAELQPIESLGNKVHRSGGGQAKDTGDVDAVEGGGVLSTGVSESLGSNVVNLTGQLRSVVDKPLSVGRTVDGAAEDDFQKSDILATHWAEHDAACGVLRCRLERLERLKHLEQ